MCVYVCICVYMLYICCVCSRACCIISSLFSFFTKEVDLISKSENNIANKVSVTAL